MNSLEAALKTIISTAVTPTPVYTGAAPQSSPYSGVIIENISEKLPQNKTFGKTVNVERSLYQIRCVARTREAVGTLIEQVDTALDAATISLSAPYTCIEFYRSGAIPKITRPDNAGVLFTQGGPEYTFLLQK